MNEEQKEIARITKGLLKGELTAKDFSPAYDNQILKVLETAKKQAILDGNVERVKKIHSAANVILERNAQKNKQTSNRPKSILQIRRSQNSSMTSRAAPLSSEEASELETTISRMKNGEQLREKDYENLPQLVQYSRSKADSLSSEKKYMEAQEIEDIGKRAQALVPLQKEREKIKQRDAILTQRITNYEDNESGDSKSDDDWQKKEDEEKQYLLNKENTRYEKQMEEFDKETNGELPPQYRKYSATLLNLQQQENQLVKARRFAEANTVFLQVSKLEKEENERNMQKWKQHRMFLRQKLEQEHQNKIDIIMERNESYEMKRMQNKAYKDENHEKIIQNMRNEQSKNTNNTMRKKSLVTNSSPYHRNYQTSRSMVTSPVYNRRQIVKSSIAVWSTPSPKKYYKRTPTKPTAEKQLRK